MKDKTTSASLTHINFRNENRLLKAYYTLYPRATKYTSRDRDRDESGLRVFMVVNESRNARRKVSKPSPWKTLIIKPHLVSVLDDTYPAPIHTSTSSQLGLPLHFQTSSVPYQTTLYLRCSRQFCSITHLKQLHL